METILPGVQNVHSTGLMSILLFMCTLQDLCLFCSLCAFYTTGLMSIIFFAFLKANAYGEKKFSKWFVNECTLIHKYAIIYRCVLLISQLNERTVIGANSICSICTELCVCGSRPISVSDDLQMQIQHFTLTQIYKWHFTANAYMKYDVFIKYLFANRH